MNVFFKKYFKRFVDKCSQLQPWDIFEHVSDVFQTRFPLCAWACSALFSLTAVLLPFHFCFWTSFFTRGCFLLFLFKSISLQILRKRNSSLQNHTILLDMLQRQFTIVNCIIPFDTSGVLIMRLGLVKRAVFEMLRMHHMFGFSFQTRVHEFFSF